MDTRIFSLIDEGGFFRTADEKLREITREKGWDYDVLRSNWLEMATEEAIKGSPPKDAGAAPVGYCKRKEPFR